MTTPDTTLDLVLETAQPQPSYSGLQRPPFPEVLDSTIISAFRSCPQHAFREYIQHWKHIQPSIHLHAGGAFARALEVVRKSFYVEGRGEEESIALGCNAMVEFWGDFPEPEGSAKSLTRMLGAVEYYFHDAWPLSHDDAPPAVLRDGSRGIEVSVNEPIALIHPETGNPLLYCGRMDMIADYAGGLWGEDDKTTSSLGAQWPKQWDLRSQFTGYTWGAQRAGIHLDGFLIRGVSILKTRYDHLPAITYRPVWQIERWYNQLLRDVSRMVRCWREGYWDFALDNACNEYGGCPFKQICLAEDPEPWLKQSFTRRVWDPVGRVETLLVD